jgi:hypothetical protein
MGLRERLRARARRAMKDLVERIIGEGTVEGDAASGRTTSWPPRTQIGRAHV